MNIAGKTVFLTGGTGFLGGEVAHQLSKAGAKVVARVRSRGRAKYIDGLPGIEFSEGDFSDRDSLTAAMQGCEIVLHIAAAITGDLATQTAANVEGTRNVLHAAAKAGVKRMVCISTIATYGYGHQGDVTEDMPQKPAEEYYAQTKVLMENMVRQDAPALGIEYVIIRPAFIYGARSGAWTGMMYDLASRAILPFPAGGKGSTHPVHVSDVAGLIIHAGTHPNAANQAFNCAPDPAPTWREYLNGYAALDGRTPRWIPLPVPLLMPVAYIARLFSKPDGITRVLPDILPWSARRFSYRMDKARELLGWTHRVNLKDGIASTEEWLRSRKP